jgi:hypothetical protein
MKVRSLTETERHEYLLKNWMTHDALWYGEAAAVLGMGEASPMNLRVCRKLGQIEFGRFLKLTGTPMPTNMAEVKAVAEAGMELLVPPFMEWAIEWTDDGRMITRVKDCFAHRGMTKFGVLDEYECGIFERIDGWLDAMELFYERTPDLSRCLKYRGKECVVTHQFTFNE